MDNSPANFAATSRRVLGLAWPVFVENFLQTGVGAIDMFMVSVLGTIALAGVGTSVILLWVVQSAVMAVAMGGNVLVAHVVGANDRDLIRRSARQALILGLLLSVGLGLLGTLLSRQFVGLLRPEEDVLIIGTDYMRVTMATCVGLVMMLVAGGILRGAGDTRTPLYAGVVMNLVNIPLSFVLIFGVAGFPQFGPVGSAWGAAVARLVGAGILVYTLWRGTHGVSVSGPGQWSLDRPVAARILRVGIPAMLEQLLGSLSMLVFSAMVVSLGTAVYAAQRITFQILTFGWMPGIAFAVSATTLTGQALGARLPPMAVRATLVSALYATFFMTLFALTIIFLSEPIASIYTVDEEIIELAGHGIRIMGLALPGFALQFVLQGGLWGAGDTRFAMWLTIASSWVLRLPVSWYVGVQLGWGLPSMYWVFFGEMVIRLIVMVWRYQIGKWKAISV